jgi:hypothetical protein
VGGPVNTSQPDFSEFVVHFTKGTKPYCSEKYPQTVREISALKARDRLFAMLEQGKVRATPMPWTNRAAVCFTECTWPSLLTHAKRYSSYGIGFKKSFLFATGGGPAIYMRQDLWKKQKAKAAFEDTLFAFITPLAPEYAPTEYLEKDWGGREPCDYTYEREWRIAKDLGFTLQDVAFVTVDTYEDMAKAPKPLKDAIGRDNWIILSNYRKIEQLWPQHKLSP